MKFLGLRGKFQGILITSHVVLGLILALMVSHWVAEKIESQIIENCQATAFNIGRFSAELIVAEDQVELHRVLNAALKQEEIKYITVRNNGGRILADTFNGDVPNAVKNAKSSTSGQKPEVQIVRQDSGLADCYDIWADVESGDIGFVQMGLSAAYVSQQSAETVLPMKIFILVFVVLSTVVLLFLSRWFLKPINTLARKAEEISRGNLDEKIELDTGDEIERLGQALERMRESIKIALDRLKKHHTLRM